MDFSHFVEWVFYALIAGTAMVAVSVLSKLLNSIDDLNIKIAVIIEKISSHEKTLDDHRTRIRFLEGKE